MNRISVPTRAAKTLGAVTVGLALVGLATLVGCQGFSSAKTAAATTAPASGQLSLSPATESFGTVQVGSSQQQSATVTNVGGSSVTIAQAAISGTGFTLSGFSTPITLAAGQSASFNVTFTPQATGSASGTVTISSDASNPSAMLTLSGAGTTATAQLSAAPATLAEGSVFVGFTGTASGSLSAAGANVTVTAASSSNSHFTISGLSLPAIVAAGTSVPFTVTYSPQAAGGDSATLTFTSTAQPSTTTDAASGIGVAAPAHSVSLSWSASSSTNVSGYNIYRAVYSGSCGSYSKINGATLDTATIFTDSSVVDGTNYCYATTAVNSTNQESGFSNIVSDVQIPAP
jgi:HYDIN/CFA65/VesB-like, Ig-like domain